MKDYIEMLEEAYRKIRKPESDERFEIPRIESMVQGNYTIIKNFRQIADYLHRDVRHMLKFFARELAAPASIQGNRAVFQTKVMQRVLQQKLESYINEYVLCKECKKPDTRLIKEGRIVVLKCDACGAKCPVRQLK